MGGLDVMEERIDVKMVHDEEYTDPLRVWGVLQLMIMRRSGFGVIWTPVSLDLS